MSNKLRFFVDCHVFDGTLQGTTTYIEGLYSELILDKTKLFFLAAHDIAHLQTIFGIHDNVKYVAYKSRNKFIRLLFDIPKLIREHQIDFAHFQYIVPPIKRCQYIVTVHDVLFMDFPSYFPIAYRIKNQILFKLSAHYSDIVLTVSDYSKRQIQQHFNISKITITPNAVNPVFFETYNKGVVKDELNNKYGLNNYFLFVSRWEPRKNHDKLLQVFVEHGFYKNYQLVLVGDPAIPNPVYDAYFKNLDAAIKQRIIVLNKVNFKDLLLLVRGASLSVYPSIAEGFGIPPLEALAANIPAICSNSTAMSEFHFMQDWLFDPLNNEDFAAKALIALEEINLAEKRNAVSERYSWSSAAAAFLEALSK